MPLDARSRDPRSESRHAVNIYHYAQTIKHILTHDHFDAIQVGQAVHVDYHEIAFWLDVLKQERVIVIDTEPHDYELTRYRLHPRTETRS